MKKILFLSVLCFVGKLYAPLNEEQQKIVALMLCEIPNEGFDAESYKDYILNDPERFVSETEGEDVRGTVSFKRNFQEKRREILRLEMQALQPATGLNELLIYFIEQHLSEVEELYFSRLHNFSAYPGFPKIMDPFEFQERTRYRSSTLALLNLLRAARVYREMFRHICEECESIQERRDAFVKKLELHSWYIGDTTEIMQHFVNEAQRACPQPEAPIIMYRSPIFCY